MTETAGYVETFHGRLPGCRFCGVIPLVVAHICEHGVAPAPKVEFTTTVTINEPDLYVRLIGRD